jgi:hypothetical protein
MLPVSTCCFARRVYQWTGLLVCGLVAGCQESAPPPTVQEIHLKQLAVHYGRYTGQHQGSGPQNEADFKAFIKRSVSGITEQQLAELFVSPRDQKPYVIAYNIRLGAMPQSGAPIVAHEELGFEGKFFAADALGGVQEVDQAELKQRALKPL